MGRLLLFTCAQVLINWRFRLKFTTSESKMGASPTLSHNPIKAVWSGSHTVTVAGSGDHRRWGDGAADPPRWIDNRRPPVHAGPGWDLSWACAERRWRHDVSWITTRCKSDIGLVLTWTPDSIDRPRNTPYSPPSPIHPILAQYLRLARTPPHPARNGSAGRTLKTRQTPRGDFDFHYARYEEKFRRTTTPETGRPKPEVWRDCMYNDMCELASLTQCDVVENKR